MATVRHYSNLTTNGEMLKPWFFDVIFYFTREPRIASESTIDYVVMWKTLNKEDRYSIPLMEMHFTKSQAWLIYLSAQHWAYM